MTTIVVDQRLSYMAADRMITSNDGEVSMACDTKIEQIEIGGDLYLVGMSGLEGPAEIFIDWFRDGDWDDPPDPIAIDEEDAFTPWTLDRCREEVMSR